MILKIDNCSIFKQRRFYSLFHSFECF